MLSQSIHFMIVPQKDGKVFRLHISAFALRLIVALFMSIGFASLGMVGDYLLVQEEVREHLQLDKEIKIQSFSIQEINNELERNRVKLAKYEEFDRKLRIISGLQDSGPLRSLATKSQGEFKGGILEVLTLLTRETMMREVSFFQLEGYLQDQKDRLARTPSVAPCQGYQSSRFGFRSDPFTGKPKLHRGMDFSNGPFTPIYSPGDGTVVATYQNAGYGNFLVIDHGYDVVTRYAHLSKYEVKVGQKVKRGDLIARMGNTGRSTATHLHYEVLVRDQHVDPEQFILQ
ncbi:MAG: M23 family metallopeptidase [SAR324 cluster bacterium]|nr:M23 family metallopeptidase [SAR324 cluster bacterium]